MRAAEEATAPGSARGSFELANTLPAVSENDTAVVGVTAERVSLYQVCAAVMLC